jgi:hypothetical protein
MSSSNASEPWLERWWPLFLIAFGLLFVTFLTMFSPVT